MATSRRIYAIYSDVKFSLEDTRYHLESLINATPTGELRNKLTEINIHLCFQQEELKKLSAKLNLASFEDPTPVVEPALKNNA